MKFHLLPVGGRFRLDGDMYVKSTPLVATHLDSGRDRLIRRSAVVEPADAAPDPAPPDRMALDAGALERALSDYHGRCRDCLQAVRAGLPPERGKELERQLESAWDGLRRDLGLIPPASG